jgi:hypothetical protein
MDRILGVIGLISLLVGVAMVATASAATNPTGKTRSNISRRPMFNIEQTTHNQTRHNLGSAR